MLPTMRSLSRLCVVALVTVAAAACSEPTDPYGNGDAGADRVNPSGDGGRGDGAVVPSGDGGSRWFPAETEDPRVMAG
jgi:hypothetical protein